MVSVKWSEFALSDLENIDRIIARRIVQKVSWLQDYFEEIVPEKLHHDLRSLFKLRVGDWRVIYALRGETLTIESVGHRKDIYE